MTRALRLLHLSTISQMGVRGNRARRQREFKKEQIVFMIASVFQITLRSDYRVREACQILDQ